MFEPFSDGYYLGRLYVTAESREEPALQAARHERVNRDLYARGEGVERTDYPLVMKVGTTHLAVHGDPGVPDGTLALPAEELDAAGVENPPSLCEVFLATADRAGQLLALGAA
jgi:hypothetical protein